MAIKRWTPDPRCLGGMNGAPEGRYVEFANLQAALAEKDAHITTLLDTSAVLKTYQDTLEMLVEKDTAYHALMHQAVWAMEQLHYYMPTQLDTEASKVQDRITEFLSTPEVQAYQAQHGT